MVLFYWLILIMPLENHPIWELHIGPFTVVKYVGLGCVAYALAYLPLRKGLPPLVGTWQARAFILFFLMAASSYFTKGNRSTLGIESPFTTYLSFLLLFFVTLSAVDSPERLRRVLLAAIGSVGFASVYVIREWQKSGFAVGFRPGWVVGDANYFTVSAAACLPLALYLTIVSRARRERLYCLACLTTTLGAIVLGASRGGLIALTVSCFWLIWQIPNRRKVLAISAFIVTPILVLAPNSPVRRLFHPNWTDVASTTNHELIFQAGLRMVRDHPFIGVGLGNFRLRLLDYAGADLRHAFIAHDAYLEVAGEMGIPALLIYLAMIGFSFRSLTLSRRAAVEQGLKPLEEAAVGIKAGLIGSSTAVLFVSGQNTKLYWLMIFLSMLLPALLAASRSEAKEVTLVAEDASRDQGDWGAASSPGWLEQPSGASHTSRWVADPRRAVGKEPQ